MLRVKPDSSRTLADAGKQPPLRAAIDVSARQHNSRASEVTTLWRYNTIIIISRPQMDPRNVLLPHACAHPWGAIAARKRAEDVFERKSR